MTPSTTVYNTHHTVHVQFKLQLHVRIYNAEAMPQTLNTAVEGAAATPFAFQ